MKAKFLLGAPVETLHHERKQCFNVVIVYEAAAAAQRAMRLFSQLEREHGKDLKLEPKCWRFDLLEDHAWRKFAAADAIKADLLILSASSKSELPATVQSWIKSCLALKRGAKTAVVGLFGTEEEMDEADSARLQSLQRATEEYGLVFFAPLPVRQKAVADSYKVTENLEEPTKAGGCPEPPLPLFATASSRDGSYRHWGINE